MQGDVSPHRAPEPGVDADPCATFARTTQATLSALRSIFGGFWVLARATDEAWVALATAGDEYPVEVATVLPWAHSLCSQMVVGAGPRVAPRAMDVPAHAQAPTARMLPIGRYVGIPLIIDGALYGTLCMVAPEPAGAALTSAQPLFEQQAEILSSAAGRELYAAMTVRRLERRSENRRQPELTDVPDRQGWATALATETARCVPHAGPAAVIVATVLGHAPRYSSTEAASIAAALLRAGCRAEDTVAQLDDDQLGVLLPVTSEAQAQTIATRAQRTLHREGFRVALGVAGYDPREGSLHRAWARAEEALHADRASEPGSLPPARHVSSGSSGIPLPRG